MMVPEDKLISWARSCGIEGRFGSKDDALEDPLECDELERTDSCR